MILYFLITKSNSGINNTNLNVFFVMIIVINYCYNNGTDLLVVLTFGCDSDEICIVLYCMHSTNNS